MNAKIDISNVILKTNRIMLRPFNIDDLGDFYEYASVDGVGQMAGWLPHKNKEESLSILKMFIDEKKTFAIVYNNKVIGSLGIEEYDEKQLPEYADKLGREIGYVLSKDYSVGSEPYIIIHDDRFELYSYGGLPQGLSEEEFFKAKSLPRNRELMRVMSDLDMGEQLGRGMRRIMKHLKE